MHHIICLLLALCGLDPSNILYEFIKPVIFVDLVSALNVSIKLYLSWHRLDHSNWIAVKGDIISTLLDHLKKSQINQIFVAESGLILVFERARSRYWLLRLLQNTINSLPMVIFSCFFIVCRFFSKPTFLKNSFRNTIRVTNSLDPDQARHLLGPDLGPNCLQRLSASDTCSQTINNAHAK